MRAWTGLVPINKVCVCFIKHKSVCPFKKQCVSVVCGAAAGAWPSISWSQGARRAGMAGARHRVDMGGPCAGSESTSASTSSFSSLFSASFALSSCSCHIERMPLFPMALCLQPKYEQRNVSCVLWNHVLDEILWL